MCGIIGFLGDYNGVDILLGGLKILQNRGYDSAGVSYIDSGFIRLFKNASTLTNDSLDKLEIDIRGVEDVYIENGIAHTRWATHGGKTNENAHPHIDYLGRFSLVHNGIIENYYSVKKYLKSKGVKFYSQTDTEVIVNTISYFYGETGGSLKKSIEIASSLLTGAWATLIQFRDKPDIMIAMKNGSPLLVGKSSNGYIITSETSGFQNMVDEYWVMEDKTYGIFNFKEGEMTVKSIKNKDVILNTIKLDKSLYEKTPAPYMHWMMKEIMEQGVSASRAINNGGRLAGEYGVKLGGLDGKRDRLLGYNMVRIIACGTSYHAGVYGSMLMERIGVFDSVSYIDAGEFYDYHYDSSVLYIVLSQSGETKDVHRVMDIIHRGGGMVLSVVNVVGSLIARDADCGVYANAGMEKAVASTKSFINQVIILALISAWFYKHKSAKRLVSVDVVNEREKFVDDLLKDLGDVSVRIERVLEDVREKVIVLSKRYANARSIFILGRELAYPVALEGALKMKEISYIHCEGYSGGALKHGPFALIEEGTPVFLLNTNMVELMHSAAEEVYCRGADTLLITDDVDTVRKCHNNVFIIPKMRVIGSLLGIIPIQMMSYYIALEKGHNPDFPRNLAKTLTIL